MSRCLGKSALADFQTTIELFFAHQDFFLARVLTQCRVQMQIATNQFSPKSEPPEMLNSSQTMIACFETDKSVKQFIAAVGLVSAGAVGSAC